MKLRHAFFALATCSILSAGALTGCAADTGETADGEDVEETADELSTAGKALIGSYKDDSGAFRGLVLTAEKLGQRNKFFADVDTGVRCITTPCPSSERIEGTFTAGSKTITFRSTTASAFAQHLLGQYKYLVQGDKFSMTRRNFAQSLEKTGSYCSAPSDCSAQSLIHPMCVGGWTCGAATNTCGWKCGVPAPVDACVGLELAACTANSACGPVFGPSACTPDGRICTADMAYKGCKKNAVTTCMSSGSCNAGQHCSTEDGVCNSSGLLAVCSGTCVN
jgi:hypothetical protein